MATKKTRPLTQAEIKTVATIAALERAISVLEESLPKGARDIDPGSYPIALTIDLTGDIVKGAPTTTTSKESATFTRDELLNALCVGKSIGDVEDMVQEGINAIQAAEERTGGASVLAAATEALTKSIEVVARARGRWEKKKGKAKKGATTGKPRVMVTGTIGVNGADMAVELTIDEGKAKKAA